MASKTLSAEVLKYYSMPKPDIFSRGVPSRLPEAYRKFYDEWKATPSPVHYRPEPGKWKRDPLTGEVWPVQNVPIRLLYPKDVHTGIWGGEAAITGFKYQRKYIQETTRWWLPNFRKSVVYSEILDKRFSLIVTRRTTDLIIDHHGFDNYLLETRACDLYSLLALKLKKMMLIALFDKTLYPDDPNMQEKVYNKYKHHLENYNREDLEWYGLSLTEAVNKYLAMQDEIQPKPLKHQFRAELIEELKLEAANKAMDEMAESDQKSSDSWLKKINPFAKKT